MAVVSKFPLLRLPQNEILRTIRVMDLEDVLKFSLTSRKCKNLVKSGKINGTAIRVLIGNYITISIETVLSLMCLWYYTESDMYWGVGSYGRKKRLTPPKSVSLGDFGRQPSKWTKEGFTMRNWLEHLQNVFNYHKIDSIRFRGNSSEFDVDDIKDVFGNITEVTIGDTGCFAFNQMILQKFFRIEELTISTENFRDSKIPPSLLMQNRVIVHIDENGSDDPTNVTLDDLLLINSKVIIVELLQAPQKLFNKFIKLWQRGSNPRMEYLYFDYSDGEENDGEVVIKGIKHQITDDRVRNFKSVGLETLEEVSGGMDVYRMDGVKATIAHLKINDFYSWQMFVWFDHCIVES